MMGYIADRQADLGQRMLGDLDTLVNMRGIQARCLVCTITDSTPRPRKVSAGARSLLARLLLD
jgi:hypothetical protein